MKPEQVLKMYEALRRIANSYETPDKLRKSAKNTYGLSFEETLEMAYENLQAEAKAAIKGIRIKSVTQLVRK